MQILVRPYMATRNVLRLVRATSSARGLMYFAGVRISLFTSFLLIASPCLSLPPELGSVDASMIFFNSHESVTLHLMPGQGPRA